MKHPVLTTERLVLRPPAAADFDAFAAYVGDPDNVRHIGGAQSRPAAWRGLRSFGSG